MTTTPLASLQQHVSASLRPGEEFLAGIRVEVPDDGHASRDAAFGVAIGSVLQLRDQKRRQETAAIPITGAGAFIGVTGERVLVFASGFGMHPTELLGAVDRGELSLATEIHRVGLVKKSRVQLLDGDRIVVDASCSAHNPDLDALRALLPDFGVTPAASASQDACVLNDEQRRRYTEQGWLAIEGLVDAGGSTGSAR